MSLGLGIILILVGSAGLWVAFHGTAATTPWGVVTELTSGGKVGETIPKAGAAPAGAAP